MKRRHTTPRYFARNAAIQAQRRFLRTRKTEAERLDDHREETGNVLIVCILAAMVAKAKTRYAVNAAGRRHLKDLVQRKKASNSSLMAELHIAKMRNDLGYFKTSPAVPTHFTGMDFKDGPSVWKAKVLKSSGMKTLPGAGGMSKGFLVKFSSGHVGMVQRRIGSKSSHTRTAKGYKRWTNAKGNVEKLVTMGSPSATAMHHTIWPEVEPSVEEYLQERLQAQVERVLARAGKK